MEKRPVATEEVEVDINRIKRRMHTSGEREVKSRVLGDWVMEELRELDEVAYVRFASVYRDFQDVNAFRDEIDRLERSNSSDLEEGQMPDLPAGHDGE